MIRSAAAISSLVLGMLACGARTSLSHEEAFAGSGGNAPGTWSGATGGAVASAGRESSGGTSAASTSGGGSSPSTGGTANTATPCPELGPPSMVALPQGFCIDSTEVTRDQYETWLTSWPSIDTQDQTTCGWNQDYAPDEGCMRSIGRSGICDGSECGSHPQVCVDWCDAVAYCNAAGKHLCGRIGGGPSSPADFANSAISQWYAACTSGGVYRYPYGDVYDPYSCNGHENWDFSEYPNGMTSPVGLMAECQSPDAAYAGVFDLSGNVYEWEDSCEGAGSSAHCNLRGGGAVNLGNGLDCGRDLLDSRSAAGYGRGFRCCYR